MALQEASRGGGRAAGNAAAPPPGAARAANTDVPGVTRPFSYNELIGKVGGLDGAALRGAAGQRGRR